MPKSEEPTKPMTVQEMAAKGGKARAKKLTKKQRQESASKAARKRWEGKPATKP